MAIQSTVQYFSERFTRTNIEEEQQHPSRHQHQNIINKIEPNRNASFFFEETFCLNDARFIGTTKVDTE